ncbi:MAG: DUF342 domain-containing protein [Spirochaetota bacterium]|nr:MAG: DUF342 domain-containing protein [Spirochaetota bacterium]
MKFKSRTKKAEKILKKPPIQRKVQADESKKEIDRVVIQQGFARKGELVAVIHPPVMGKDGKNVLGEIIPSQKVDAPSLIAGRNIKVQKGTSFFMGIDGMVEVLEDNKGNYYIRGKLYRQGIFSIDVSTDEMCALLTVEPSLGGAPAVEYDAVIDRYKSMGIVYGLKEDRIRKAIQEAESEKTTVENVIIAEGSKPVNGEDGSFEFKVRLASGSRLEIKEDGRTDFKEYDLVTRVKEGDLVAVMKKAGEGVKDGKTIKDVVLPSKKGHDVDMSHGKNIRVEERDETIFYYSEIAGQLLTDGQHFSVEPLLVINGDVGTKTGNIDFDGSVLIRGNVNDSFRVRAGKDITIQGNVGSAFVHSDGNITVKNGVIGKYKGLVTAKGDIILKFTENSHIQAHGDIIIQRAALNCKLVAGGRVVSTQEKGQVVGGEIKAQKGLEVKVLGNVSENKMNVYIGTDFFLESQINELKEKMGKYENSLDKLKLLLDKLEKARVTQGSLSGKMSDVYDEARKKSSLIKIALEDLMKKEQEYSMKLNDIQDAEVVVYENLNRGVKIYFGMSSWEPETTKRGVKVYYDKTYRKIDTANL